MDPKWGREDPAPGPGKEGRNRGQDPGAGPAGNKEKILIQITYVFERSDGRRHTLTRGAPSRKPLALYNEARGARVQAHDSPIPSMRCRAVEEQRRFRFCRSVR